MSIVRRVNPRTLAGWAAGLPLAAAWGATTPPASSPSTAMWGALLVSLGVAIGALLAVLLRRRLQRSSAEGPSVGPVDTRADITAQRSAEAALHIHQVVVNSTSDMISVIDEGEVYRMVNDAWCAGTGIRREEALGRTSTEVLPALVGEERRRAAHDAFHARRSTVVAGWEHLPGLQRRYLESTFYPFAQQDERQPMVVIITRDLTRRELDRDALAAAAEVLRCTLNTTGDALFATDSDLAQPSPDEHLRFANDQLFRLFELPDAWRPAPTLRQISEGIDRWLPDPAAERIRVQEIVAGRAPAQDRLRLIDGRVLLRRFSSVPMAGHPLRVWSLRDITVEVAAVEAQEADTSEQRTLLDQYPGYIAVVDEHNRYQYVNDRLARLMRTRVDQIVGHPIDEVMEPTKAAFVRQLLERVRRGGQAQSESAYPADATHPAVDLEVTHKAGPRNPDGSGRVYVFGTDITERKRAQRALTLALAEAERANKTKSQFLSRMSHELRTPLNAVLGFSQLLQAQATTDEQRQQVGEILRGGRHLLALINDLLDLGRIEAGELDVRPEPVPAGAVMADSLGLLRPLALDHGVSLSPAAPIDAGVAAWADARRLSQVLLNLLTNGIKYNRRGGRVDLEAEVIGGELEFRVTDTGPGLTEDEQQRLFRPFERLGATQTAVDGTGIGLALCRSLVEAMGGRIGVRSVAGQGSTFWVRLPLATAAPAPTTPQAIAASPGPRRLRALYIEDNPVNQVLMDAMLAKEFDLDTEADPLIGLEHARSHPPDLILLDIQLPGIDGFEVLRRLRADARTAGIPVVAVSANAMPSDLEAGAAAGFQAYLTKPVDLEDLLTTVRRVTAPLRGPVH